MQITTNTKLVQSRGTWGKRLTWIGFIMLFGAVFMPFKEELLVWSWPVMLAGFLITNLGMYGFNRYARPPLATDLLEKSLKGLDQRYRLYNYTAPVDHVLLTPIGVMIITLRRMGGEIRCQGDKWQAKTGLLSKMRFFVEDQLGNPADDFRRDVDRLQKFLEAKLASAEGEKPVPLGGFVYFSDPEVKLTLDQPTVPVVTVVTVKNLKDYFRRQTGEKLPLARFEEIAGVLEGAC